MKTQIILNRIRLFLAYIALYLVLGVFSFIIIMFVASVIIMNGDSNELGRAGEGILAVYIDTILSFFIIAPALLWSIFYWRNKKAKRKIKNDNEIYS